MADPAKTFIVPEWLTYETRAAAQEFIGFAQWFQRWAAEKESEASGTARPASESRPFQWTSADIPRESKDA